MTEVADGRQAAWISAWQCIEAAQSTRNEVFEAEADRTRNASSDEDDLFFSQRSTLYNALMREAEVFVGLASVATDVGVYAGTFIRDYERRKSEQKAEQSEFITAVISRRNECADCGVKLTSDNRMQVIGGVKTIYVCREHYGKRTEGGDDAQG